MDTLTDGFDDSEHDESDEDNSQDDSNVEEEEVELESSSEMQESSHLNVSTRSDWTGEYGINRESMESAEFNDSLDTSQTSAGIYAEGQAGRGGRGRGNGRGGRGGRGRGSRGSVSFSAGIDDGFPKKAYSEATRGLKKKDKSIMLMNAFKEQEATILGSRRAHLHKQAGKISLSRHQRVRSWARVLRSPKPGIFTGFLIPTWVPVQDLSEDERKYLDDLKKTEKLDTEMT